MSAAFPPRSLGAPSSRLIARRENSAAALRSLAGSAGGLLPRWLTANANIFGIRGLPRCAALSGGWAPGLPVLIYQVSHAAVDRNCGDGGNAGWETADRHVHDECAARRSTGRRSGGRGPLVQEFLQ